MAAWFNGWRRRWETALAEAAAGEARSRFFLRVCLIMFAANALFFYFLPGVFHDTRVNVAVALAQLAMLPLVPWRRGFLLVMHTALVLSTGLVVYVAVHTGGINASVLLWLCMIPMTALLLAGIRQAMWWVLLIQLVLAWVWWATLSGQVSGDVRQSPQLVWVVFSSLLLCMLTPFAAVHLYDTLHRLRMSMLEDGNEALRTTHAALVQAQSHKDEFVAAVGHELRTPMSAILGLNSVLRDHLAGHPDQVDAVDHIRRSTQHLLGVVNNILDFSQLQAGELRLQPDWMDLKQAMEDVLDEHRDKARNKSLQLHWQMTLGMPSQVMLDRLRFKQVVANLLDNAIRYSPEGAAVGLFLTRRAQVLRLDVSDQGPGVDADQQQRIFRLFENNDGGRRHNAQGTGLGLSICQQLVALHGGRVGVHSEKGHGATFWVEWPVQADIEPPPAASDPQAHATVSLELLVVDDDGVNRLVTELQLRKAMPNAQVHSVASAAEAQKWLQTRRCDVVLLDMYMPGMSGLDLARWVRDSHGAVQGVTLIGLTASTHPDDWQRCIDAGMNGVLTKPLDVPRIVQTIHRHWRPREGAGA